MRILYVPFHSNVNLGGCSIFNNLKVLLRTLVERHEDIYVYYPLPPSPPFDLSAAEYLNHPRIETFPVSAYPEQGDEAVSAPSELFERFNIISGRDFVDVVICDKPRISLWLRMILNNNLQGYEYATPVVNYVQYPLIRGGRVKCLPEFEYAQVLGWYSGHNIWCSHHDYELGMRCARKYAKGSMLRRIQEQSHIGVGTVIDHERIDRYAKPKPRGEIRINYASRLGAHYRFKEIFKEIETLYCTGRDVRLVITSPSPALGRGGARELKDLKTKGLPLEIHAPCPQESFYEIGSRCHVSLYLIRETGPSLALREQVYMGQAVIVPRERAYEELLPDWPYMYDTDDEMRVMLRHVVENYWADDIQEALAVQKKRIREEFDAGHRADELRRVLQQALDDAAQEESWFGWLIELVAEVLKKAGQPDSFSWAEFSVLLKEHAERRSTPDEYVYLGRTRWHFVHAIRKAGYVDSCDRPEQIFRRVS